MNVCDTLVHMGLFVHDGPHNFTAPLMTHEKFNTKIVRHLLVVKTMEVNKP